MSNINIFIVNDPKFVASNYQTKEKVRSDCPCVEDCEVNRPLSRNTLKTTIKEAKEALFDAAVTLKVAERTLKDLRIAEAYEAKRRVL